MTEAREDGKMEWKRSRVERVISFGRWHSSTLLASIAFRSKLNETTVLT